MACYQSNACRYYIYLLCAGSLKYCVSAVNAVNLCVVIILICNPIHSLKDSVSIPIWLRSKTIVDFSKCRRTFELVDQTSFVDLSHSLVCHIKI